MPRMCSGLESPGAFWVQILSLLHLGGAVGTWQPHTPDIMISLVTFGNPPDLSETLFPYQ